MEASPWQCFPQPMLSFRKFRLLPKAGESGEMMMGGRSGGQSGW